MVFDHPLVFSRSITRIVIIAPLGYGRVAYRKMIGSKFGRKQHHLLRSPRFASVGRMLIGSLIPEYGSVRKVLRHACPEATGDLFSVQIVGRYGRGPDRFRGFRFVDRPRLLPGNERGRESLRGRGGLRTDRPVAGIDCWQNPKSGYLFSEKRDYLRLFGIILRMNLLFQKK